MNIIDFLDDCRYWGTSRNKYLDKIYFYQAVNKLTAIVANLILPVYFLLTRTNPKYSLENKTKKCEKVIISLTSFPPRLPKLHLVIECLLRQTVKPDAIILHLTKSQVESVDILPEKLLALQRRGLKIELCPDNIRSHTKYYYAFKNNPEDIVITVDDDLFYRTDLVENLLDGHRRYPEAIIANWVKEILPGTTRYSEWPDMSRKKLANNFLLFGVSGVLYPPHCMHEDLFNLEMIKGLCLTADDVWLSCMALLKKTAIFSTGYKYNHLPVSIRNNETLLATNCTQNNVQVDNLNSYYFKHLGIRPFIDLPHTQSNGQ